MTYIPSRNRVCSYSYVNEKDLPPGKKLQACSKCKETCYIDRESQVASWKVHREVCDPAAKDFSREQSMTVFDSVHMCAWQIEGILDIGVQHRIQGGRLLLYYLQQLRGLIIENSDNLSAFDNSAIAALSEKFDQVLQNDQDRLQIWSIPGFANYFLSEDILLSDEMKARKEVKGPLPPKEVFVEYCEVDPRTSYEEPLALPKQYWKLLLGIYLNSAFIDDPDISDLLPRPTSLTAAIIAHIMKAFQCPYTRVSLSASRDVEDDSITLQHLVSVSFYQALINGNFRSCHERWRRDDEIVPGITVKEYLKASMLHEAYFAGRDLESITACLLILSPGLAREDLDCTDIGVKRPWEHFKPKDRLELLDIFLHWDLIRNKNGEKIDLPIMKYMLPGGKYPIDDVKSAMLTLIMEPSTNLFLDLYEMIKETDKIEISEKTRQFIYDYYDSIMSANVPGLDKNLRLLENECNRKRNEKGESRISLPDELRELIYQYSLPRLCFDCIPYKKTGNMTTKLYSYLRSIDKGHKISSFRPN